MYARWFGAPIALATGLAGLAVGGLAVAQHGHGEGHSRPERWKGPNITTVATQRYIETAIYPTYAPILPRTMSGGEVRPDDDPRNPSPYEKPGGTDAKPTTAPTGPGEHVGPDMPTPGKVKPFVLEPGRTDHTAVWSNFLEANRRRLLTELRDHRTPSGLAAGPLWKDRTVQALMRGLADRNTVVSGFAAAALGGARRPEFFKLLKQATLEREQRGDHHIARSGAILALGMCSDPRAGRICTEIIGAHDPKSLERDRDGDGEVDKPLGHELKEAQWRSAFALLACGLGGEPEWIDFLAGVTRRDDLPTLLRSSAALGLGHIEAENATKALVSAVLDPQMPHVVRGIATLSVARRGVEPLPGPFSRPMTRAEWMLDLLQTFGRDSRSTRLGAAMGLWHCAKPEHLPEIITHLNEREDDTQTRATLLMALAWRSRGVDDVQAAVLRQLRRNTAIEKPAAVRGFALFALGVAGNPAGAAICRERLSQDPDPHVQAAAAMGLALLEGPKAVDPLVETIAAMRSQPNQSVDAAYVIEALGWAGGPDAQAILKKLFGQAKNVHERRAASVALALTGDTAIVGALLEDLESEEDWRPAGAAQALRLYTDASVRDRVRPLATNHEDAGVRELAITILSTWIRHPDLDPVMEMSADGVVFPKDGEHVLNDLLNWP